MSHEITWSRQAKRALQQDLPKPAAAACLEFVLGPLAENPHRVGKPLTAELEGLDSARRGEFRVIYRIEDHVITIHALSVKHRRDAYRR